jgi:hypothetical protein
MPGERSSVTARNQPYATRRPSSNTVLFVVRKILLAAGALVSVILAKLFFDRKEKPDKQKKDGKKD